MISIKEFVREVLLEDNGRGDLFYDIAPDGHFTAKVISKDNGILAGVPYAKALAEVENFEAIFYKNDGDEVKIGDTICVVRGGAATLLSSERTLLNMLQHASGIATLTRKYVKQIEDLDVVLLDTRKTRPNLRMFEKYAARVGGAINHRLGVDDCLMLKDTHKRTIKDLKEFVEKARKRISWVTKIEIECEDFEQVIEAMEAGADIVMCDNMNSEQIHEIVEYRDANYPHVVLEASGNINENTIRDYALSGVDAISSGSITHQATWIDFSMRFQ